MCASLPEDMKLGVQHFEARRRAWLGKDSLTTDDSLGLQSGTVDTPESELSPPAAVPISIPIPTSVQSSDSSSPRTPNAKLPHSHSPRSSAVLSSTVATIDLARAAPLEPPGTDVPRLEVLPTVTGTAFVSLGPSQTQPGHPPIPHLAPSTLRAHAKMLNEPSSGPASPRGLSMGPRGHGAAFAQVADERVLAILGKEGKLSDEDWRTLRGVHTALMGGQRLRVPMPMDKLVKLLQAGWQRDGTWPPGADAPDY
ncbi:hypothetical protein BKA62DRAFT_716458 [Auriculariales sp. MPI-PUGE-AT-0066]|nr:hypothetical protein BKA62DRAFT_716458 [Auriculariales sp. MPI-PUGE-AT-0066]